MPLPEAAEHDEVPGGDRVLDREDSEHRSEALSDRPASATPQSDGEIAIDEPHDEEDNPAEALLSRLGLSTRGVQVFHDASGSVIGDMNWLTMGGDAYLRCVCRCHDGCTLFMKGTANTLQKSLKAYEWLDAGRCTSKKTHLEESAEVKATFGIRARSAASGGR